MKLLIALSTFFILQGTMIQDFSAQKVHNGIELVWEIEQSAAVDYFMLEYSTNGKSYEVKKKVDANQTKYKDTQAQQGKNFYRLKVMKVDGTTNLSDPILVEVGDNNTINIPTGAKWRSSDYNYKK